MPFTPTDAEVDPPRQAYFHGTKASFKQGDVLLPRKEPGGAPANAPLTPGGGRLLASDEYVYVTRRYLLAWAYSHESGGSGDPIVLWVEPQGAIEPDPESSDHMYAYRCQSARVSLVDDRVAISAEVAREAWQKPADELPTLVVKNVKPQDAPD